MINMGADSSRHFLRGTGWFFIGGVAEKRANGSQPQISASCGNTAALLQIFPGKK